MKKILILAISLFILSNCKSKKEETKEPTTDVELVDEIQEDLEDEVHVPIEPTDNPKANPDMLDPKQGIIVVFNEGVTETEDLIGKKGLEIEKYLVKENSLTIGLVQIPADKKDYWLDKLINSGDFKDVKIYSPKNLDKLVAEQKLKMKITK